MASWIVPTLVGGALSLFGNHSANKRAEQERTDANHRAQQAYNSHLASYNNAIKMFNFRKQLAEGFIDKHGLKPGQAIVDYLNAPTSAAPSFEDVGGGLQTPSYGEYNGGESGLTSFLGGAAGHLGKVLGNPNRTPPPARFGGASGAPDTGDFSPGGGGVGPTAPSPNAAPGLDLDQIEKDELGR